MGTVYLNCFHDSSGTKAYYTAQSGLCQKRVGHYLGYTSRSVGERQQEHAMNAYGHGPSALMFAVRETGLHWRVVRTWTGSKSLERQLRRWGSLAQLCPVCNPRAWRWAKTNSHRPRSRKLYGRNV